MKTEGKKNDEAEREIGSEMSEFLAVVNDVKRLTTENFSTINNYFFMIERYVPISDWLAGQARDLNHGCMARLAELYRRIEFLEKKLTLRGAFPITPVEIPEGPAAEEAEVEEVKKDADLIFSALSALEIAELCQLHELCLQVGQVLKDICTRSLKIRKGGDRVGSLKEEEILAEGY